jgi:hypothetical protein
MREDTDTIANAVKRIAEMPAGALISEEDVKNKVVLPIFRALGYEDNDFNYERRTGRGYVDVVVEHFPVGIVVESKAPRTKLDNYREQLEAYVFHKHGQGRTTVAILTDGEKFKLYGISGAFYKGSAGRSSDTVIYAIRGSRCGTMVKVTRSAREAEQSRGDD